MYMAPLTDATKDLLWADYTTLSAINTCPRWGLVRYIHGKTWENNNRAMALEAGSACHEVFAAVRFFDLLMNGPKYMDFTDKTLEYIYAHAERTFGYERWNESIQYLDSGEDQLTKCIQMSMHLLNTCGFYDDPRDRRRTLTNIETACLAYIQRYEFARYIPVVSDDGFVGIEVPISTVVCDASGKPLFNFRGKVDALCHDVQHNGHVGVHENKTGARIDAVWAGSHEVSHQVTGYMLGASVIMHQHKWLWKTVFELNNTAIMWGLQLPLPAAFDFSGISRVPVTRDQFQLCEWYKWVEHTMSLVAGHLDTPTDAPGYTHSCSRYFTLCSFVPLCTADPVERKHVFEHEMIINKWNPLDEHKGNVT